MKEPTAVVTGILIAPVIPAVTMVVISVLHPITPTSDLTTAASALLVSYLYSLSAAVVIGLPAFLVLRYLRLVYWWTALAVGCGIGALMSAILPLRGRGSIGSALLAYSIGAAAALVFWIIWEWGRRERGESRY